LSDTSTYDNANFATLGATFRTYVWTWGTGAHADSFTLNITATAVLEPSGLAQLGVGLAGLALAGIWRRRRRFWRYKQAATIQLRRVVE
jgi:MYXO-CTERM domain-containing protein